MYKLTLVPLFALSLVFAIPQPIPDQINELGKRNDRGHIFTGQATIFIPYTGPCNDGTGEKYSVAVSQDHFNDLNGTIPCPGIPVNVQSGSKIVTAWITNYCDVSCGISNVNNESYCAWGCKGDDIEMNFDLFGEFYNLSEVPIPPIPVRWVY